LKIDTAQSYCRTPTEDCTKTALAALPDRGRILIGVGIGIAIGIDPVHVLGLRDPIPIPIPIAIPTPRRVPSKRDWRLPATAAEC